jgi:hypothetical protein
MRLGLVLLQILLLAHTQGTLAKNSDSQAGEFYCSAENLSTNVGMATLAILTFRLLFYSQRELSFTVLLFCAACAWCTGELVAVVSGNAYDYNFTSEHKSEENESTPKRLALLAALASIVRTVCQYMPISETVRETCARYTEKFV